MHYLDENGLQHQAVRSILRYTVWGICDPSQGHALRQASIHSRGKNNDTHHCGSGSDEEVGGPSLLLESLQSALERSEVNIVLVTTTWITAPICGAAHL